MLDESMFEDIHEIAENSLYLKAVEEKDVSLEMLEQLPPYDELRGLEEKLRSENKLSFDSIFHEPTGYYMLKCFLAADYAVDKAIFIKDVEAYKSMRFESARRKVALLLYQRFVANDEPQLQSEFKPGSSVFQIIHQHKGADDKAGGSSAHMHVGGASTAGGSKGLALEKSDNKSEKVEKTVVSSNLPSQSNLTQLSATTGHGLQHMGVNSGAHGPDDLGAHPGLGGARNRNDTAFQMGSHNNPIGVYGKSVRLVKEKVMRGEAPKDLFDDVARDVMTDLKLDVFPRFLKSDFYKKYIRTKWIETQRVTVKDFTTFRVLGRGGFGAVHACRKKNSGQIYAMKCFPEEDTRILTNRGFMFLRDIETAAPGLLYAAYDTEREQLVYVPGKLVLPPGDRHSLVNITAGEKRDPASSQLSLRVTPDHHLYVQRGQRVSPANDTIAWEKTGGGVAAPVKLEASELVQSCACPADQLCMHRRAHARFTSVAVGGVANEDESEVEQMMAQRLGLHDSASVNAFLELYGFWLGNGQLHSARDGRAVSFSAAKGADMAWLQAQLSLCGLTESQDWTVSAGQDQGARTLRITNANWLSFFTQSECAGDLSAVAAKSAKRFAGWVWRLAQTRVRIVLRGLHRSDDSWTAGVNAVWTAAPAFRDALTQLCMHAGFATHFEQQQRVLESVTEGWRVHWSEPTSSAAQNACWPVVRLHDGVTKETYRGRIWCVQVAHKDHLIVAQRAHRSAAGVVTHASRPVVVGQCINKKLVKVKSALDNVLEERNVLTMVKGNFVTNLKYALQDEETLYLIMDLMLGGDLKFHLINAGRFTEKRARFYAAQVLLGLEHVHKLSIIYRDMKLENVLLDGHGHCRLSDLGLAVVTKVKIKGYAGTPGYTAPEMIKNKLYGPAADIFSFGVMLYRMLCGSKPFKGKVDRDLDKAVIERKPQFPKEIFSKEAILLLTGLLQKRPENRLGCGERGIEEIKEHPFFASIDWGLLEAGYIDPPFVPNKFDVNAASLKDIGDFDRAKYKHVKLDERFKQRIKNFEYVSAKALQDEMVLVLEKADENINFEKFAQQPEKQEQTQVVANGPCCSIA